MMPLFKLLNQDNIHAAIPSSLLYPLVVSYGFVPQQGPYWVLDEMKNNHTKRYTEPLQGKQVTIYQFAHSYCTGSYNLLTMQSSPCPRKKVISSQQQKCRYCKKTTGFHPAFDRLPHKHLSPQQQSYNQLPHDVYLAYFIPGIIKVGIAYHHRLYTRLLEQGAQAALVIQESDNAYEARKLEKAIATLGLQEKIKKHQKATWLAHAPYQSAVAREQLIKTREKIYSQLGDRIAYIPTIYEFQSTYWPSGIPSHVSIGPYFPSKVKGKVIGMVGSLLALKTSSSKCLLLETQPRLGKLLVEFH
ncbi:MAG: DUF2797 domain-containing protein [Bacteroidota bacterium]